MPVQFNDLRGRQNGLFQRRIVSSVTHDPDVFLFKPMKIQSCAGATNCTILLSLSSNA